MNSLLSSILGMCVGEPIWLIKFESGSVGHSGQDGSQGLAGPKGEAGVPGRNGQKGERGIRGQKGDRGLHGDQGIAAGSKVPLDKNSYFHY